MKGIREDLALFEFDNERILVAAMIYRAVWTRETLGELIHPRLVLDPIHRALIRNLGGLEDVEGLAPYEVARRTLEENNIRGDRALRLLHDLGDFASAFARDHRSVGGGDGQRVRVAVRMMLQRFAFMDAADRLKRLAERFDDAGTSPPSTREDPKQLAADVRAVVADFEEQLAEVERVPRDVKVDLA